MSEMDVTQMRRKRVQRLKKIILGTILLSILIPIIVSICLAVYAWSLSRELRDVQEELRTLKLQLAQEESVSARDVQNESMQTELLQQAQVSEVLSENISVDEGLSNETESRKAMEETAETPEVKVRKVYLTFDDGPSVYTNEILDILAEYDVKATFFVLGKTDEASVSAYRRIVEEGHTLGMHSYSHKYAELYGSVEQFSEDFWKIHDYLYDITGVSCKYYRFPGGSSNTIAGDKIDEFTAFLEEQGVSYYDWNISSGDASGGRLSAATITDNVMRNMPDMNTAIVLMHDSGDKRSTVEALPGIIEQLLALENTEIHPISQDTVKIQHRGSEEP